MLKLNQEQFYGYLTTFIMETREGYTVPDVMYEYLIPNPVFHKFINEYMIEAWNESVDWDKERQEIIEHIMWYVPDYADFTMELEDWLTCTGVLSYRWETDNEVYVELDFDEKEFLDYVCKNFKYVKKDGARSWEYNYEWCEKEDGIKELLTY